MKISEETIKAFQKVITGDSLESGNSISPYRSGPDLVSFFNQFGESDEYGQGFPSRWYYAEEKLKKFNDTETLKQIVESAVDPRHFLGSDHDVNDAVDFLNQYLVYDDLKIIKPGKFFRVRELGDESESKAIEESIPAVTESEDNSISIFISHSSKDVEVAEKLVTLLRTALKLDSDEIRCTSVDGYRLPGGANTNEQLKEEIYNTKSFIGLITPNSLESSYVLFELGARWGAKRQLIPLLSNGVDANDLVAPLKDYNALDCGSRGQMLQLVTELSQFLNREEEKPALYSSMIDDLITTSSNNL